MFKNVELSVRAMTALGRAKIASIETLVSMRPEQMWNLRPAGWQTQQEIGRACLRSGCFPFWLPEVARSFKYKPVRPDPAKYVRLTEAYAIYEHWMLESAICQLGKIDYVLSSVRGGLCLWRDKAGYIEMEPEEAELKEAA